MSKIDKVKEHIGALKMYLGLVVAIILTIGAGIAKLYNSGNINALFWIGLGLILVMVLTFVLISKSMHREIDKLEEIG